MFRDTAQWHRMTMSAYLSGAAYGAFWGVWGASVPRVQQQAGFDDGQLGVALLCIGAGPFLRCCWPAGRSTAAG